MNRTEIIETSEQLGISAEEMQNLIYYILHTQNPESQKIIQEHNLPTLTEEQRSEIDNQIATEKDFFEKKYMLAVDFIANQYVEDELDYPEEKLFAILIILDVKLAKDVYVMKALKDKKS
jgi:Glu-tRNA(Gln) amidotransferase subunit E-like FAD-binding protein